jgi:senataxin
MDYRSLNNENLQQTSESSIRNISGSLKDRFDKINLSSNSISQMISTSELDSSIKENKLLGNPSKKSRRKKSKASRQGNFQDSQATAVKLNECPKNRTVAINSNSTSTTQTAKLAVLESTIKDNSTSKNSSKKSRCKKSIASRQKNLQIASKDTAVELSRYLKDKSATISSHTSDIQIIASNELDLSIKGRASLITSHKKPKCEISTELFQLSCYNYDITLLDEIVLKWDYNSEHQFPVSLGHQDRFLDRSCYNKIPNRFQNAKEYINIIEPLIILEGWAQFQQSKYQLKNEDNSLLFLYNLSRANEFVEMRFVTTIFEGCNIYENDIMFIWLGKNKEVDFSQSHHSFLIKVTKIKLEESDIDEEPLMHIEAISFYHGNSAYYDFENKLRPQWIAKQVMTMTTLYREYLAVKNLALYPLCKDVLNRNCESIKSLDSKKISDISNNLNVNLPQAHAIGATKLIDKGFYMIQGPPGTGKTKTIVGLVGYFASIQSGEKKSYLSSNIHSNQIKPKTMICAPSNAAVDEVVRRLKLSIKSRSGICKNLKLLRIGKLDTTQFDVRDAALDTHIGFSSDVYIKASKKVHKKDPKTRLASLKNKINKEKIVLKAKLLAEADVICCTLSRAGHRDLNDMINNVKVLIIDEAAQATEPSCLIPLRFNSPMCIMVGDPRQLPPTVISQEAIKFKYDYSLFDRMYKNHPQRAHLLSIQYRMHPEISIMPSKLFYDKKLTDGPGLEELKVAKWHKDPKFGPYVFYDVLEGKEQRSENFSLYNSEEACVAIWLVESLVKQNCKISFKNRISVITPYKNQVKELSEKFEMRFGNQIFDTIEIDTVDGFQGQEKDIIIFSTVRTSVEDIGFLSDKRRMNVSLTRARNSLFIIANSKSLSTSKPWSKIVKDAISRKVYIKWTPDIFEPMNLNHRFSNLIKKRPFKPSIPMSEYIKPTAK